MPLDPPRGFAQDWPVHLRSERGGFYLWFVRPDIIVSQATVDRATLTFGQEIITVLDAVRWKRHDALRARGGVVVIHDWSRISRIDSDARAHISAKWKSNVERGDLRQVVTAMDVNPMVKMAFAVVNIAASFVGGADNRLVDDVTPWLKELNVGVPLADEDLAEEQELVERRARGEPAEPLRPATR